MTWQELCKDPRWQRKRLEILQRDNWACVLCSDKTTTLHVHHCYYEGGRVPWDYPLRSLVTLCEPCHKETTERGDEFIDCALSLLKTGGFTAQSIYLLATAAAEMCRYSDNRAGEMPPSVVNFLHKLAFAPRLLMEVVDFVKARGVENVS